MIYVFGERELDEDLFELRQAGRRVELQPKALELLLFLVRNRERAVSKREILETVWPGTSVTENSLARAVRLARVAIGDGDSPAGSIVTVPRRGYRFAAPVRALASAEPAHEPVDRYVGRAQLLGRLGETVDRAVRGAGRVLFLVGEAGIGKTRTAEVLAQRAQRGGALVAAAWGQESVAPTYAIWARALWRLSKELPEAPSSLPLASRTDLGQLLPEPVRRRAPAAAPAGDSARFRLFEAVQQLLAAASARRPIALVLDDLHNADAESLWLLESVGQAIRSLRIAIVATCREQEAGRTPEHARALERLLRLSSLERWPLVGLRGPEVREFVSLRVGGEPATELVEALERKTGGNPLLLGESLRSLEALGLLGTARDPRGWQELLPAGIQHLLRPKLVQLSPAAIEVLSCAAAIGLEFERALLARCTPDRSRLERGLREALDAGLLQASACASRLRFAHALVREALYAELVPPGEARRALHARITAALESGPAPAGPLAVRALHACEAAPLVDPAHAAALAQAAAEEAARLHDFESTAEWYERALAALGRVASPDPAWLATLHLGLGDAQARTVGLERARASYRRAAELARSLGDGNLLGRAALGLAQEPNAAGEGDPELVEALEEAQRAVPEESRALRIRLQSRLGFELRELDRARGQALVEAAVSDARRLGDPAVLARTLEDWLFVSWSPEDPAHWIAVNGEIARAARAAGDFEFALVSQQSRLAGFLELGNLAAADREIRACARSVEVLRTPRARWQLHALRAMRALVDGDLEAAERDVAGALELGGRVDGLYVAAQLSLQVAYLRLEQGRAAEIEAGAREQVRRFPESSAWRAGVARLLVAAGRTTEAREELGRLAAAGFADVPVDRGWLMTFALAGEVALATGDVRTAELLEPILAPYASRCVIGGTGLLYYGPVQHHLGILALARSRWEAAVGHFEQALAVEERTGARIWDARTRIGFARALLGRGLPGDRARAMSLVSAASKLARARGWLDVAAEARAIEAALWTSRRRAAESAHRSRASEV